MFEVFFCLFWSLRNLVCGMNDINEIRQWIDHRLPSKCNRFEWTANLNLDFHLKSEYPHKCPLINSMKHFPLLFNYFAHLRRKRRKCTIFLWYAMWQHNIGSDSTWTYSMLCTRTHIHIRERQRENENEFFVSKINLRRVRTLQISCIWLFDIENNKICDWSMSNKTKH